MHVSRGSCNNTRRVLRRSFTSKCFLEEFLEGFLEGACKDFRQDKVLRSFFEGRVVIEGTWKVLRGQKHVLSQSTTPSVCTHVGQF